jgi:CspA family cold shock protein
VSDKRGRDRRPRRGRSDEEDFPPEYLAEQPAVPIAAAAVLDATVTRFDATRGFGFVAMSDGSPDAFLHISALSGTGRESVSPGDRLRVKVADGPKGRQVIAVVSLDAAKAPGPKTQGTVLWFNPDKGYGFVKPDDGEKNIFVGMKSLRLAGLANLIPGQRVEIEVMTGTKGPEARALKIIESKDAAP